MNIIDYLKPKQKQLLKTVILEKGQVLFHELDVCKSIGIVIKGKVSIVSYLENGKEIIYNQLSENEIFGNNLIFSSSPYYKGNIISLVNSEIVLISKKDLIYLLRKNEEFMIEYLRIQSNFSKSLNNKIKLLSLDNAEERLLFYLHENKNVIAFASITNLAKQLHLERETLSRLISRLTKQRKIKKERNRIELL